MEVARLVLTPLLRKVVLRLVVLRWERLFLMQIYEDYLVIPKKNPKKRVKFNIIISLLQSMRRLRHRRGHDGDS